MTTTKLIQEAQRFSAGYRITNGKKFRLHQIDPSDTGKVRSKAQARTLLKHGICILKEQQEKLYAQDRWSLLVILQGMDASGKDSVIKHVMSGINPQGCEVYSFKQPSSLELDHDYLWRCAIRLPERGRIGIFNRSYYEEVLIVRVHPNILAHEKLPPSLITKSLWDERFQDIRNFESYLGRNGVVVLKFFLHISKEEQKARFLKRLDEPEKHWKFSTTDVEERKHWDHYRRAYEEMVQNTATEQAPWYVVPADNKWFAQLVVAGAIIDTLASLPLHYPIVTGDKLKELSAARQALLQE